MNSFAQDTVQEEIKTLSKNKWQWMADKDVDKLGKLFDSQAMFTWVAHGTRSVS